MTERLALVPVASEHVQDLVLLHSGPDVAFWYAGAWTEAQARAWATQMHDRWKSEGVGKWMAYRRSDGDLVGHGGLTWTEIGQRRHLELGWAIREQYRGQGYATEIGRVALAFAFDHLEADEVVAFTELHNRASRAVMVRLGMFEEGLIYRSGLLEGRTGVHERAPFALYRIGESRAADQAGAE